MKNNIVKEKKISNNSLITGLILIAIYFVLAIVLEIINFNALGFGFMPKNVLFDLAFLFIVCGIMFLISNNIAKIVVGAVVLLVQVVINAVNSVLIRNTGLIFHLQQLADVSKGAESLEKDMINYGLIFVYLLIFAAFLVLSILVYKKVKKDFSLDNKKRLAIWLSSVFAFVAVGTGFVFIGNAVKKNIQKEAYAFAVDGGKSLNSVYIKNATLKNMGTFGYYFNDLCTISQNSKYIKGAEKQALLDKLQYGVVDDEKLFNIAKDDNLIYILLESFDMFSIDPYNTPNLWKLAYGGTTEGASENVKWGRSFSNFYGLNYTNDSEIISLLGHTTEKYRFDQSYQKVGLTTPYSLPNLFRNAGYESVNYFHGYTKEYYLRNELYSAMGFHNVYGLEDAKLNNSTKEFGDWVLDSEYISAMMDKFIPEGKSFFSYYASISTHGPYSYDNARFDNYKAKYDQNLNNYKAYLESIGYVYPETEKTAQELRQYKSAVMDVDYLVELIFKELKRQDILNKTTIVLFSDHCCFYNDLNAKVKNLDAKDFSDTKLYNIPLIIYNDSIAASTNSNFCNTYDLYPTVCDMFGLEYNEMLTQGYSVFDSANLKKSVHISFKHGIYNLDYYTEDLIDIKQINQNPTTTLDEFKQYAYEFFVKQETIEDVYRNNIYKK